MVRQLAVPGDKRLLGGGRVLRGPVRIALGLLMASLCVSCGQGANDPPMSVATLALPQTCTGTSAEASVDMAGRLVIKAWYPPQFGESGKGGGIPNPVLFFNAGWGGSSDEHTDKFRALIARGFVIISVDHRLDRDEYDQFLDFSSEESFRRTKESVDQKARRFALDNVAVFDALQQAARCATASETIDLAKHLDFARTGIFGYSFGGAVAAQTAWQDRRFKAALNLDGWLFADAAVQGVRQAFMEFSDDTPLPTAEDLASPDIDQRLTARLTDEDYNRLRANMTLHGGYYLVVLGSRHSSFVDIAKRSTLQQLAALLPSARRVPEIVNAYVAAFFGHYVVGAPSDLIDEMPSPYAQVRLEFAKPPASR